MKQKYIALKENYSNLLKKQQTHYNTISYIRLTIAILISFCIYKSLYEEPFYWYIIGFLLILFFILMKIHSRIAFRKKFIANLLQINSDEIEFLTTHKNPFDTADEYINPLHQYSYDLDIFGENSLFHYLNRTATTIGKEKLVESLLQKQNQQTIIDNQIAIKELSQKITFRQEFLALAQISKDNKKDFEKIKLWISKSDIKPTHKLQIISYIFPILTILTATIALLVKENIYWSFATIFFSFNILLIFSFFPKINREIMKIDKIYTILSSYSLMLQKIENEHFISEKLLNFQQKLNHNSKKSSKSIAHLGELISKLESINNLLVSFILNGTFLYHLHSYIALNQWKKNNLKNIFTWIEIIGEIEALNSLANFSFNNPHFIFPKLNNSYSYRFTELGHPLIAQEKRIYNNITIENQDIILLTGSNMSGKSTFLRTIGINIVLAGIGAPICATESDFCPIQVFTSMRQFDSLNLGESYFFAEVKRLKQIIDTLSQEKCFILLDEILKGTNSDDKQQGTIGIIQKLIQLQAQGILATHDLAVCAIENQHPTQIHNYCFEVEIKDNELHFDYKLRKGICKNKSATFLMNKQGII